MEVFPDNIYPTLPVSIKSRFRVISTQFDTGIEFRRRKWRFPLRRIEMNFNNLPSEKADQIRLFVRRCYGMYEPFWWFDYTVRDWVDEFVGRGDGTVLTFDLPGKEIDQATLKVYKNGVEQISGTDYTFSSGSGEGGADQITFTAAPADGDLITADFTGKIRLKCRIADDTFAYNIIIGSYRSFSLTLQEVR